MDLFEHLKNSIYKKGTRIVFPEPMDERVLRACTMLYRDNLVQPILIGNPEKITHLANKLSLNVDGITIIDIDTYPYFEDMVKALVDRRKGKVNEEQARQLLQDENYFGTMLVYMDKAEGMVSGAIHSTGDTVRPALQIIKTKPGVSRTSGAFLMLRGRSIAQEQYLFADCAINVNPTAEELADIAIETAKTADMFGIEPRVAMLSFSTKGSANAEQVDKVRTATEIIKEKNPYKRYLFDGELQFDAAYDAGVAKLKAPMSKVAGKSNVFVFPELQSGNIGYKIAQRLGGFEAIGPILQGLNKPVSDLSRGTSVEDIYKLSIITAAQSLMDQGEHHE